MVFRSILSPRFGFVLGLTCLVLGELVGQPPSRRLGEIRVNEIDQEEGVRRIESFRNSRLRGDYIFDFELRYMPRSGEDEVYLGSLSGTWNDIGPVTRMDVTVTNTESPEVGGEALEAMKSFQLLVQNGRERWVERRINGGPIEVVESADLFEPVLPGLTYSAFDLQMPFIFWDEFAYEGSQRVKGRPAHLFLMYPPDKVKAANPNLYAVRMALDNDYNALLRVELINQEDTVYKSFRVLNFKKVSEEWIIKTIDLVNDLDRDKTRLRVLAAALGLNLNAKGLAKGGLLEPLDLPPGESFEPL